MPPSFQICETCKVTELCEGLMDQVEKMRTLCESYRALHSESAGVMAIYQENMTRLTGMLNGRGCTDMCEIHIRKQTY